MPPTFHFRCKFLLNLYIVAVILFFEAPVGYRATKISKSFLICCSVIPLVFMMVSMSSSLRTGLPLLDPMSHTSALQCPLSSPDKPQLLMCVLSYHPKPCHTTLEQNLNHSKMHLKNFWYGGVKSWCYYSNRYLVKTFIHTAKFATKNTINTTAAPVMRMPSIWEPQSQQRYSTRNSTRQKKSFSCKVKKG